MATRPVSGTTAKERIKLAQDEEQRLADEYSYTVYDELSRTVQTGQVDPTGTVDLSRTALDDQGYLYAMVPVTSDRFTKFKEITSTTYGVQSYLPYPSGITQQHLRGRISSATTGDDWSSILSGDLHSSIYSYDEHGNVHTLQQHVNGLESKTITYAYDLLGGGVTGVSLESGESDQIHYRYTYDADNRLVQAFSSRDGLIEEEDARYFYYAHGPLARKELGEDKIAGEDYYYTLHGWLKGVNMADTTHLTDPGQDGTANHINGLISRDEMAFGLGYYEGDYSPVGSGLNLGATHNGIWSSFDPSIKQGVGTTQKGLFNGNITWMVTALPELKRQALGEEVYGYAYQYDQLHRIKQAESQQGYEEGSNWTTRTGGAQAHDTRYSYDAMGNITGLKRYDNAGAIMDSLAYGYDYETPATEDWLESNRLYHVNDQAGTTTISEDIEDQGTFTTGATIGTANNYGYDKIGNLIRDDAEEIETITWTVYGKVETVERTGTSTKPDLEFGYDAMGNRVKKVVKPRTGSGLTTEDKWTYTYYLRDAQGNILATYSYDEESTSPPYQRDLEVEHVLYGSDRLGTVTTSYPVVTTAEPNEAAKRKLGNKAYQQGNHLNNTLLTLSDKRSGQDTDADGKVDYYLSDVRSVQDYFPFGMQMPGRVYSSQSYSYGFNGVEKENEIAGIDGAHYFTQYRMLDVRTGGRWYSQDPIVKPWESPYAGFSNNPILYVDPDGLDPRKRAEKYAKKHGIEDYTITPYDKNGMKNYGVKLEYGFVEGENAGVRSKSFKKGFLKRAFTPRDATYENEWVTDMRQSQDQWIRDQPEWVQNEVAVGEGSFMRGGGELVADVILHTNPPVNIYELTTQEHVLTGEEFDDAGDYAFAAIGAIPIGGVIDDGGKVALNVINSSRMLRFAGDEAVVHFGRHSESIMKVMNKTSYSLKNYLDDANHIVKNGQYTSELNGYVKLIGSTGSAKYGFVGINNATGKITTFHVKTAKELSKKAPSLGITY